MSEEASASQVEQIGPHWKLFTFKDGSQKMVRYNSENGTPVEYVWGDDKSFEQTLRTVRVAWPEPAEPKVSGSVNTEYFVRHFSGTGSTYGPIDSERDARLVASILGKFTGASLATDQPWQAYKCKTVIEETIL